MVQVIDTVGDAGGAECIRFRVRRSRRDPNLILGSYASAINASIAWIWNGGFHATLGAPPMMEECALPTRSAMPSYGSGTKAASISRVVTSEFSLWWRTNRAVI
jgi:hypothetical protein